MAEIKWIKITTNMFDDEKIKLIDAMPERDTIFYIWIRLLVQAGKTNAGGYIFLTEKVPYNEEMLSTIFNRQLSSIRLALQTLRNFGMIELDENNLIKIANWEKHQNIIGMDKVREQTKNRVAKYREKQKLLIEEAENNNDVTKNVTLHNDIEQEQEEDKELDIEITTTSSSYSEVNTFKHFERCNFKLSPIMIDKINSDIEIYSKQWVMEAAVEADLRGKHTYAYYKAILENWQANGKGNRKKAVNEDSVRTVAYKPFQFID